MGQANLNVKSDKDYHRALVASFLHDIGLPEYHPIFIQHGYDSMKAMKTIESKKELLNLGINILGHRSLIIYEIQKLRARDLEPDGAPNTDTTDHTVPNNTDYTVPNNPGEAQRASGNKNYYNPNINNYNIPPQPQPNYIPNNHHNLPPQPQPKKIDTLHREDSYDDDPFSWTKDNKPLPPSIQNNNNILPPQPHFDANTIDTLGDPDDESEESSDSEVIIFGANRKSVSVGGGYTVEGPQDIYNHNNNDKNIGFRNKQQQNNNVVVKVGNLEPPPIQPQRKESDDIYEPGPMPNDRRWTESEDLYEKAQPIFTHKYDYAINNKFHHNRYGFKQ